MQFEIDGAEVFADAGARPLDPAAPLAVLLHGAGFDHSVWASLTDGLEQHGWGVLAPDLPGHGQSGGAPLASISAMTDWVMRLMALAGMGAASKVKLAGHSMGALVALDAAARYGAQITELALIGVAAPVRVHPALLAAAAADDPAAIDMIVTWAHAPGGTTLGEARRVLEQARPGVLEADLTACSDYEDASVNAAKVTVPVTLILGERDRMTPARGGRALANALPNARVVMIDGAGHMLMAERPHEVLAELVA